jgi:hypothetical protein
LHDAIAAERLGIPSVGIMTTQFASAAQLMARVLGAEGYPFVVIEHPISSATSEQLAERAAHAAAAGKALLLGTPADRGS